MRHFVDKVRVGRLALIAATSLAAFTASAASLGDLIKVTGPSPFANCTADQVGQQVGTNYPNTGIEPTAAVNPREDESLLVGWQQDRWSNGGDRGLEAAFRREERSGFQVVAAGAVTKCQGGAFSRASDPWADFSPIGVAYYMHLALQPDLPNGGFGPNGMLVTRSFNGGRTWSAPATLIYDTNPQVLNDKNSITADPRYSPLVYAVWDRLQDFTIPPAGLGEKAAIQSNHDGVVMARQRVSAAKRHAARLGGAPPVQFIGPAYFSRTINFGSSWSTPKIIFDPGDNAQTINNRVVVLPNGNVLDFFTHIFTDGTVTIDYVRSIDHGATFGAVANAQTINYGGSVVTPDAQAPVRDAAILFDVTVDKRSGAVYLVWQDSSFNTFNQVAFSQSLDGGATWSAPVRIDKSPANANDLRHQAFIPTVAVGPHGKLVMTYYDFRNDKADGKEATDYWALICNGACTNPANWGGELRLSKTSFDMLDAPFAGGQFLGDYMSLKRTGDSVAAVFGLATGKNLTDIFVRKIRFGDNDVAGR